MMQARRSAVALAIALLTSPFVAAACSSDEDGTTTTSSASTSDPSATASSTSDPGPATSGPPATASSTPPVGTEELPVAAPGEVVDLGGGVRVSVVELRPVDVQARGPGETDGPGVAVAVEVVNGSNAAFDLGSVVVNASTGPELEPAIPSDADPAVELRGSLAPGATAEGVYVFQTADDPGAGIVVDVSSGAAARVARFRS
jgi:hypothetical protein